MTAEWVFWLSSDAMTVQVTVDALGRVTKAAPIVRRFLGQDITHLTGWMRKQGGLEIRVLDRPRYWPYGAS